MSNKSEPYATGKPDADVSATVAEAMATIKEFVKLVESIRVDATVDEAKQIRTMAAAVEYDLRVLRRAIDDALHEVTHLN